eukprot:2757728-Rhodomonas_salina.6
MGNVSTNCRGAAGAASCDTADWAWYKHIRVQCCKNHYCQGTNMSQRAQVPAALYEDTDRLGDEGVCEYLGWRKQCTNSISWYQNHASQYRTSRSSSISWYKLCVAQYRTSHSSNRRLLPVGKAAESIASLVSRILKSFRIFGMKCWSKARSNASAVTTPGSDMHTSVPGIS